MKINTTAMESTSTEQSNPFFMFEVSNVCATCTKQLLKAKSYSVNTMLDIIDNVNLYHVLESQFQFKYEENGPSNICRECFSKTLLFYEFHEQCKNSVKLFSKYVECKKQITTSDIDRGICDTDSDCTDVEVEETCITESTFKILDAVDSLESAMGCNSNESNKQFTTAKDIGMSINDTDANSTNVDGEPDVNLTIKVEETCITEDTLNADNDLVFLDTAESVESDVELEDTCMGGYTSMKVKEEFNVLDEVENIESDISNSIILNQKSISPTSKVLPKCKKTKQKFYKCTLCDAIYSKYHSFITHTNLHTKRYACSDCDKVYACSTVLKTHQRTHTNERPYSCKICAKAFTSKHNLKSHLISHAEDRPFQCEVCRKTFKRKNAFSRHMLTH